MVDGRQLCAFQVWVCWSAVMYLSGRGLLLVSYVPFWLGFDGIPFSAFLVGVGSRQVSAFLAGGWW
jgi:hypothetical protein